MHLTYADVFRPATRRNALAYDFALVLAGSIFIALLAQLAFRLPGNPVPVTGQTLGVLLVGALLGSKRGPAAVVAYLVEGACGIPVFAKGGFGLAYMLGPTGGYLLAFVAAGWLTGLLAQRGWDRRVATTAGAMLLGNLVIHAGGAAWLACFVGPHQAVALGVLPFVVGDAIKLAIAALMLPAGWGVLGHNPRGPQED